MFEVSEITFLTSAKVSVSDGSGRQEWKMVNVDLINRKVFETTHNQVVFTWNEQETAAFFAHLDQTMHPPENLYANRFGVEEDVKEIKQQIEQIQDHEAWETK